MPNTKSLRSTTRNTRRRRSRSVKDNNSFSYVLRKIRKAQSNQMITIPIKYYTKKVELVGEQQHDKLVFKNFIKGAEMMTPRIDEAAVENLFESGTDYIEVGQIYTLWYDDKSTGLELRLYRKPSLDELMLDNQEEDEDGNDIYEEYRKPMNIVYVFVKL